MSETELSVICKNCGSEVSPYVTECPYCGTRLRKRAPKLERRGDALEAQRPKRRRRPRLRRARSPEGTASFRPYATATAILRSGVLLVVQKASGGPLATFGGLVVPFEDQWWRLLTAPFAYVDVGYLFVVALGLAIFATPLERRLRSIPTAALLRARRLFRDAPRRGARRDRPGVRPDRRHRRRRGADRAAAVRPQRRPRRRPGRRRRRRSRRAGGRGPARRRLTRLDPVPDESEFESAIERLLDPERFSEAERIVARAAPQLQQGLAAASAGGGV